MEKKYIKREQNRIIVLTAIRELGGCAYIEEIAKPLGMDHKSASGVVSGMVKSVGKPYQLQSIDMGKRGDKYRNMIRCYRIVGEEITRKFSDSVNFSDKLEKSESKVDAPVGIWSFMPTAVAIPKGRRSVVHTLRA